MGREAAGHRQRHDVLPRRTALERGEPARVTGHKPREESPNSRDLAWEPRATSIGAHARASPRAFLAVRRAVSGWCSRQMAVGRARVIWRSIVEEPVASRSGSPSRREPPNLSLQRTRFGPRFARPSPSH
jgi:hypothetical protein